MKTNIIQIGNSQGLRLSKSILDQCNIKKNIILKIINNKIIIEPDNESRKGWNEIFTKMAENKDDKLLIDDSIDLDNGDWEW